MNRLKDKRKERESVVAMCWAYCLVNNFDPAPGITLRHSEGMAPCVGLTLDWVDQMRGSLELSNPSQRGMATQVSVHLGKRENGEVLHGENDMLQQ